MATVATTGIAAGRLSTVEYQDNFGDLHAPLSVHEAAVAADRCYFCYDAPCQTACPTDIDIPQFIREIASGSTDSAARTIFSQNILGGMCARVCPTETLCEEVCVRETAEGSPVEIGRLQRFATDIMMTKNVQPFTRAAETGKKIAVVGAGPAGLSAAHRLASKGHTVTIFDGRSKAGGLNEYGIASYKSVDDFAQAEVNWLLSIGGITIETGQRLGAEISLPQLQSDYDAVFLGIGLAGVNALGIEGEDLPIATDAVDFIEDIRQVGDISTLPVGRNVIVIGGGMTAVDAAVQAKLMGAQNVTMLYRRGKDRMGASEFEQDLATSKGVQIIFNAQPVSVDADSMKFAYTADVDGKLTPTGETFTLPADQVFKAIGQTLQDVPEGLEIAHGKITVSDTGASSITGIWAGGDCASGGDDLTVTAVAEGRDAAEDIHSFLTGGA
ncbi:MAG: NAD(P)-dependent oxidoreductase [Rhodobacteraceae bacterium]|nr:NAD(P)-dependent oxidoreductase [Paracoccaceae bacterium]